jgi:hypothetical protein
MRTPSPNATRRRRLELFVWTLLCPILPATAFAAGDCNRSTITTFLVGNSSGNEIQHALGGKGFEVVARDAAGNALPNVNVILDLDRMGPLIIRPMRNQNAGITVNCATKEFSKMTDAAGLARFGLRFGKWDAVGSVGVTIDGTQCPIAYPARSTDIDGQDGGALLADFSAFAAHYVSGTGLLCCDWNLDGELGLADLAIFSVEFLFPTVGEYCP